MFGTSFISFHVATDSDVRSDAMRLVSLHGYGTLNLARSEYVVQTFHTCGSIPVDSREPHVGSLIRAVSEGA